jgi:hypothetical protein
MDRYALIKYMEKLSKRAKALGSDILVYLDERENISYCAMTHRYTPRWYHIGIVTLSGEVKINKKIVGLG